MAVTLVYGYPSLVTVLVFCFLEFCLSMFILFLKDHFMHLTDLQLMKSSVAQT